MTEKQLNKLAWNRTKKGLCYNIYSDQKQNSKYRLHRQPEYSRDELHYNFKNIQLMTFKENELKFQLSIRKCEVIHKVTPQKKIKQYDQDMNFIAEYSSMQEAHRATGLSQGNISMVCSGKRQTTGNYKWAYSNE